LSMYKLVFPLALRRWKEGIVFNPLVWSQEKEVSLRTQIIIIRKENIWILWSGNTIVWVVSLRQGEQFRVDSKTQNILKIELE
jgi:tRNA(Ile)-lysidine synthase